ALALPEELLPGESGYGQSQVDPIEQRPRHLLLVEIGAVRVAAARLLRIALEPARARVCRGDEREPGRELRRAAGSSHHDSAVFQGLTQTFQRVAAELRELVQEQDAV